VALDRAQTVEEPIEEGEPQAQAGAPDVIAGFIDEPTVAAAPLESPPQAAAAAAAAPVQAAARAPVEVAEAPRPGSAPIVYPVLRSSRRGVVVALLVALALLGGAIAGGVYVWPAEASSRP
jgi:hypothetical protein